MSNHATISWSSERQSTHEDDSYDKKEFENQPLSLIKESLQNSQDVPLNIKPEILRKKMLTEYTDKETVNVTYQVLEVSGKAKKEWLKAFRWESFAIMYKLLKKSMEISPKKDDRKQEISEIKEILKEVDNDKKPIYILNVVDRNTTGLLGNREGSEEDSNFFNFHFAKGDSDKAVGGGSWAVGKTAFLELSRIDSFMTLSNLSKKTKSTDGSTKKNGRIFGISRQRPTKLVKEDFQEETDLKNELSPTWQYGYSEEVNKEGVLPIDKPRDEIWEDEELGKKLLINCLNDDETGTVLQIPFIKMPIGVDKHKNILNTDNIEEFANKISDTIYEYAWPSLISKKIKISVEYGKIDTSDLKNNTLKTMEIDINKTKSKEITILSNLTKAYFDDKKSIQWNLDEPIDDIEEYYFDDVTLEIDNKEKKFEFYDHKTKLFLKVLSEEEKTEIPDKYLNKIALVRGAGLVVEYRNIKNFPLEEVSFIGVNFVGCSLQNQEEDIIGEEYIRLSENKAHNTYITHSKDNLLKQSYYPDPRKQDNTVNWSENKLVRPLYEKINNFFIKSEDDNSERLYEIEDLVSFTASGEEKLKEILNISLVKNTTDTLRIETLMPKHKKAYSRKWTINSVNAGSIFGEVLGDSEIVFENILDSETSIEEYKNDFGDIPDNEQSENLANTVNIEVEENTITFQNLKNKNLKLDFSFKIKNETKNGIEYFGTVIPSLSYKDEIL